MEESAAYSAPPYRLIPPLTKWLGEQGYTVEVRSLFEGDDTHLGLVGRLVRADDYFLYLEAAATPNLLQVRLRGMAGGERLEVGFGWLQVQRLEQVQWLLESSALRAAVEGRAPGPPSVAHGWLAYRCPECG
ncbi:hypothetical protein [Hymenobacter rigui]|uniref:Uncharacterized protein n=1 Tax=Hymenobacter rigui TaxID=334424 RepID=A0A3R9MGB1_9BACT|nr:hypothetical protein [Hymenobacter rigui]RSK45204.1 hypothetical protein EI291_19015 [Hymenobacter rigui]